MNAQVELERLISRFSAEGKTPSLLLHACCAPCASYCIEYLVSHFDLTLFYYNPNITERVEYDKRLKELERFAHEFGVNVIDGGFDPNTFFEHTKGLEREPERGGRCSVCFELRLKKTQEEANGKYDYFATTLTLSPLKNANLINAIGQSLQGEGTTYLPTDFKKREGYKRSIELSNKYGLYRQNYCGCVYSKK